MRLAFHVAHSVSDGAVTMRAQAAVLQKGGQNGCKAAQAGCMGALLNN